MLNSGSKVQIILDITQFYSQNLVKSAKLSLNYMIIISSFVAFVIINIAECQDVIHPLRRLSEKNYKKVPMFFQKHRDFFLEAIPLTP